MIRPTDVPTCDLLGSDRPLAATYDVALLDLDGVCFAGAARVPHAAEGVNGARAQGMQRMTDYWLSHQKKMYKP